MSAVVEFPARRLEPEALAQIAAFAPRRSEPDWLTARRRRGLDRFAEQGYPNRRGEAWRYVDLEPLKREALLPPETPHETPPASPAETGAALAEFSLADAGGRIVLVDGRFAPSLSAIAPQPGLWLGSTVAAIGERPHLLDAGLDGGSPFAALNAALFSDGFVLDVAPGTVLDRPIEIIHVATEGAARALHTRSVVALGAGSRATLVETYAGAGRYWRNDIVTLRLADRAELDRVVLIEEAAAATHLGENAAILGERARLSHFVLLLGGGTVRHEAAVRIGGADARCGLDGAFVVGGRQQASIVTTVDHDATGGETRELFKGVAAGRAHGAFQGRITVHEGAQKTDAQQTSRNLLLGRRAVIDTKPELEIYADDVKCSHGATVGDLDAAMMFYLRARGLSPDEARRLLIEAFVREAVERVSAPALREHLLGRVARRLAVLEEEA